MAGRHSMGGRVLQALSSCCVTMMPVRKGGIRQIRDGLIVILRQNRGAFFGRMGVGEAS